MLHVATWVRAILSWGARAFLVVWVTLLPANARACAVCISWTDGQGSNGGFYWSWLLLTALPFAIVAVIGAWVGWAASRVRQRQAPGRAESARSSSERNDPRGAMT